MCKAKGNKTRELKLKLNLSGLDASEPNKATTLLWLSFSVGEVGSIRVPPSTTTGMNAAFLLANVVVEHSMSYQPTK